MANLLVIDKDGSLTTTISGAAFPQSPTDQQLLPGALDLIQRLQRSGKWTIAIASNQGGCDWNKTQARNLKAGSVFRVNVDDKYESDEYTAKSVVIEGPWVDIETDRNPLILIPNEVVLTRYKTIESAIEECQFAADLCGITDVMFCPVMDGSSAIVGCKVNGAWMPHKEVAFGDYFGVGNFRKPGSGMLDFFERMFSAVMPEDRTVMIGDRPDDRGAAEAAGFEFFDAEEWRTGKVTIE